MKIDKVDGIVFSMIMYCALLVAFAAGNAFQCYANDGICPAASAAMLERLEASSSGNE